MKGRTLVRSILGAVTLLLSLAVAAPALAFVNWPGYLFDPGHSSLNSAATQITPATAGALAPAWSHPFTPGGGFVASPVVYNGFVYIGGTNGVFYQLNEATGAVVKSVNLGTALGCSLDRAGSGVEDTATVVPDPSRGGAATVYVTGANGTNGPGGVYLWALDAKTLNPVWPTDPVTVDTQAGAVGWASPVVSNGTIAVGVASGCDNPLVRGSLNFFSQANGALVSSYQPMPAGSLGGTIWATPVVSGSSMWVATGNSNPLTPAINGDSFSIVRLQGATKTDIWTVPALAGGKRDYDFGQSPTLFTGVVNGTETPMIGACSKDGTFYALQSQSLSTGPVWTYQLATPGETPDGTSCLGSTVWDAGAHELIAGSDQTPTGQPGSIQALSPDAAASHRVIWQAYLPCAVIAPPSEDGAGVLAVVTYGTCSPGTTWNLYLYNAHATVPNGSGPPAPQLLKTIPLPRSAFSQPTFADGYLFVANDKDLMAYSSPPQAPRVSRAQIKSELVKQLAPVGKRAKLRALLTRRGYTYSFRTLTAGRLQIAWELTRGGHGGKPKSKHQSGKVKTMVVAVGKASFSKAGLVKLKIKLTRTGMRMLKAASRLTLTAKGTYLPAGERVVTATKRFVLRR